MQAGPILDTGGMDAFLGHIFCRKGILFACIPETDVIFKQFKQNVYFKTQGTILAAIVAPIKGLE